MPRIECNCVVCDRRRERERQLDPDKIASIVAMARAGVALPPSQGPAPGPRRKYILVSEGRVTEELVLDGIEEGAKFAVAFFAGRDGDLYCHVTR